MKDFPDAPEKVEIFEPVEIDLLDRNNGLFYIVDRGEYIEALHCRQGHHKPEQLWSR